MSCRIIQRYVAPAWLGLLWVQCVGCSDGSKPSRTPLKIAAAASLTDVFQDLEPIFEAAHPEIDVQFIFAGSQVLRWQIESGLSVDLFASADLRDLHLLQESGRVANEVSIASNALVMVYRPAESSVVQQMSDLDHIDSFVLGVEGSPIGRYTEELLMGAEGLVGAGFRAGVHRKVVSYEKNVRLLRSKVEIGGVAAAVVYASDVRGSHGLSGFRFPPSIQPQIRYPIALLHSSSHQEEAGNWIRFIQSNDAQTIWTYHGFGPGEQP